MLPGDDRPERFFLEIAQVMTEVDTVEFCTSTSARINRELDIRAPLYCTARCAEFYFQHRMRRGVGARARDKFTFIGPDLNLFSRLRQL